jgi:flavin-dependent dehydrogenase
MLARSDIRVSLVHWGGYAPGGTELVSGRARRMVEQHCPDFFLSAAPGVEVNETISFWSTTEEPVVLNATFDPWGPGLAIERSLLDDALRDSARMAGAAVLADAKVLRITRADDRWKLSMRSGTGEDNNSLLSARFVVLAAGRSAAPFFDRPLPPESSKLALMASLPPVDEERPRALYLERSSNGWWYALPVPDGGYFAGFCLQRDELKKRMGPLKEFFVEEARRTRLLAPLLRDDVSGLHISGRMASSRPFSQAAGENWIVVGDAAYAPDPLSRAGIELALESAQAGAQAVVDTLNPLSGTEPQAALAEYDASMQKFAMAHENRQPCVMEGSDAIGEDNQGALGRCLVTKCSSNLYREH